MVQWAVARSPWQLDLFRVDDNGAILTAAWDERLDSPGVWRGWWRITDGVAIPNSTVTAVARDPDKLDVFIVADDGSVWTAAWDQHVANGAWRGWWPIAGLQGASPVSAAARTPHHLDVFAVSDGEVRTAAWAQDVANGQWQGWWKIGTHSSFFGGGSVRPEAPLSCVSRGPGQLDVVAVAGQVHHGSWDHSVAGAAWQGWTPVGGMQSQSRAAVVSPKADRMRVFSIRDDDVLHTAEWSQGSGWGQWSPIEGAEMALPRLTAVARSTGQVHVFMVSLLSPGGGNGIVTAMSDPAVAGGTWSKLELIPGLSAHAPRVAAVARGSDKIDVFARGEDQKIQTATWSAGTGAWGPVFQVLG